MPRARIRTPSLIPDLITWTDFTQSTTLTIVPRAGTEGEIIRIESKTTVIPNQINRRLFNIGPNYVSKGIRQRYGVGAGNGSSYQMVSAFPLVNTVGTIFVVYQVPSLVAGGEVMYGRWNGAGLRVSVGIAEVFGTTPTDYFGVGIDEALNNFRGTTSLEYNVPYIGTGTWDGANVNLYHNGALENTRVETTSPQNGIMYFFGMGTGTAFDSWTNALIAEIIHYRRVLTTAERHRVTKYLSSKYGIDATIS